MPFTTPATVVAGQLMTAAYWNSQVRDNVTYLADLFASGTWTPTVGGSSGASGQTYINQVGHYVKVGQLVYLTFYIVLSAKGTINGTVQIEGLPAYTAATANTNFVGNVGWANTTTAFVMMQASVSTGPVLIIGGQAAAATNSEAAVTSGDLANNTTLYGTVIYRATA